MTGKQTMIAAVLAGGRGTRLQSVVADRPKVLAEVNGRPFLEYILRKLEQAGIAEAALCTGFMAEAVENCFGKSFRSLRLAYSREETPLGTGGALRAALPLFRNEKVLVLNGDSFFNADIAGFADWFAGTPGKAAMLLARVDDLSRYGAVSVDAGGRVVAFHEKTGKAVPGLINAGIYLFRTGVLNAIPEGRFYSLEKELFPELAASGQLYGLQAAGEFIDIGTPESYCMAQTFFRETRQ